MQIYDYSSYLSLGGIDQTSYLDTQDTNDVTRLDDADKFNNVLQDYMTKDYNAEVEAKATEVQATEEKETNSNYLSDLSESLMSTSSGRKVIASMMENQIMGIVTGNVDEESGDTLQSILLGTEGLNTASSLEQTLQSLQSVSEDEDKK